MNNLLYRPNGCIQFAFRKIWKDSSCRGVLLFLWHRFLLGNFERVFLTTLGLLLCCGGGIFNSFISEVNQLKNTLISGNISTAIWNKGIFNSILYYADRNSGCTLFFRLTIRGNPRQIRTIIKSLNDLEFNMGWYTSKNMAFFGYYQNHNYMSRKYSLSLPNRRSTNLYSTNSGFRGSSATWLLCFALPSTREKTSLLVLYITRYQTNFFHNST